MTSENHGFLPDELDEEFYSFLRKNADKDFAALLLSKEGRTLDAEKKKFASLQIRCRRKFKNKLIPLIENERFLFPDLLVAEQSSNYEVAMFNASVVGHIHSLIDLTAGLGVDSIAFSTVAGKVTAVERDGWRSEILRHNLEALNITNVEVIHGDAETFIKEFDGKVDVIYIDPARRDSKGNKKFRLEDCEPDILKLVSDVSHKCGRLLIKSSPLLDITEIFRLIPETSAVRVVEYKRECKEVLIEVSFHWEAKTEPFIESVDLSEGKTFRMNLSDVVSEIGCLEDSKELPKEGFIYEPGPALMKSGLQDSYAGRFQKMKKLDKNTHLYFSEDEEKDFQGRVFEILGIAAKKDLKDLKGKHLNVITRNYPEKAENINLKYKFITGGDIFLIACRVAGTPVMIKAKELHGR